jgi:hypothetical protein
MILIEEGLFIGTNKMKAELLIVNDAGGSHESKSIG